MIKSGLISQLTKHQPHHLALGVIALLGALYAASKILGNVDQESFGLDFRVIWLAGRIWSAGQNPYGPTFLSEYLGKFGSGMNASWLYPPYWYPLAVLFSFLPFAVSNIAWNLANFALLIAASHLIARAITRDSNQKYLLVFLAGVGFACLNQATAKTLHIGQTPILVYFGFSAMIFGLLEGRQPFLVIGLFFLALKPNIGIVAFSAVMALHRYRWSAILAGAICLLATLPILVAGDYRSTIGDFVLNLGRYPTESLASDNPQILTGFIHIAEYLFGIRISALAGTLILIFAAMMIAFAIFYCLPMNRDYEIENVRDDLAGLSLFIASTFLLVPLHSYDLVSLTILFMMIFVLPSAGRWLVGLGLVLCLRAGNISSSLGMANPNQGFMDGSSLLLSVALSIILLGAVLLVLDFRFKALGR